MSQSNECVMLQHLRYPATRTRDTAPEGRGCKWYLLCMRRHVEVLVSNPMLAETFEDVRMKYIAEKVSHNPVVIAYHAEGDGWELHGTSAGKTKFWG